jgi:hypothetical protein
MKIIRTLGLIGTLVGATAWLEARSQRQRAERRERESIEKTRWEGEGGATPAGSHINEMPPNESAQT